MMRVLWPLFMLAIAAGAILSQLDRQARIETSWAGLFPHPYQGFTSEVELRRALQSGDPEQTLHMARKLVAERPIPAEHFSWLAQAELAAGNEEKSIEIAQRAAHRSWRGDAVQQFMLRLAMAEGDDAETARRLAALWAIQSDRELLEEVTPILLEQEGTQREFAQILAGDPRWGFHFNRFAERNLTSEGYARMQSEIGEAQAR